MFGSELTIPRRKLDGGAGERFFYVYLPAPDAAAGCSRGLARGEIPGLLQSFYTAPTDIRCSREIKS
jgi:hypothetical protein